MDFKLDGATVGSILIGMSALFAYLVSQGSAKAREDRRRLRRLVKRDIAWTRWAHNIEVWLAEHGYEGHPRKPAVLDDSEDDGE